MDIKISEETYNCREEHFSYLSIKRKSTDFVGGFSHVDFNRSNIFC